MDETKTSHHRGRAARDNAKSAPRTDAATFEVVKNSLYAVAEEMKVVLAKTAYSPILKVAGTTPAACSTPAATWWRRVPTSPSTSARCRTRSGR